MKNEITIAIVGFGLSGLSVLYYLIKSLPKNGRYMIDIYERDFNQFCSGAPYSINQHEYFVNRKSNTISIFQKNDFIQWMIHKYHYVNLYIKRDYFGFFLRDKYFELVQTAEARHIKINTHFTSVSDVKKSDEKLVIVNQLNERKFVDYVVFAIGSQGHYLPQYDHQHDLQLLGAGLSALDVILSCNAKKCQHHITLTSSTGLMNSVNVPTGLQQYKPIFTSNQKSTPKNILEFYRIVLRFLKNNNIIFYFRRHYRQYANNPQEFFGSLYQFAQNTKQTWHEFLSIENETITKLWKTLPLLEQQKINPHYASIMRYRVGMPMYIAKIVNDLMQKNQLNITTSHRCISNTERAIYSIDCTGNLRHDIFKHNHLLQSLRRRGYIKPAKNGLFGIELTPKTYQPITDENQAIDIIFFCGNVALANDLFVSQMEACVSQAKTIASTIAKRLLVENSKIITANNISDIVDLTIQDVGRIQVLRDVVLGSLENSDHYVKENNENEFIKTHLIQPNKSFGVVDKNNQIVAYACIDVIHMDWDGISKFIEKFTKSHCHFAVLSAAMVHPDYRGYHLQRLFITLRERYAKYLGIASIISCVSVKNTASIHNLFKAGYRIMLTVNLDDGRRRHIFHKKL